MARAGETETTACGARCPPRRPASRRGLLVRTAPTGAPRASRASPGFLLACSLSISTSACCRKVDATLQGKRHSQRSSRGPGGGFCSDFWLAQFLAHQVSGQMVTELRRMFLPLATLILLCSKWGICYEVKLHMLYRHSPFFPDSLSLSF